MEKSGHYNIPSGRSKSDQIWTDIRRIQIQIGTLFFLDLDSNMDNVNGVG